MILTLAAKELKSLFASPLAWLILTAAQLVCGYAFLKRLDDFLQIQPQLVQLASPPGVTELVVAPLYAVTAIVLIFAAPLLGMRLIAEERRNQTLVLLTSAPVSMTQIVLGKFFGVLLFLTSILLLVTLMPLSLAGSTALDYGLLASLVLGVFLLGAGFAALSLWASSLSAQPVAAAFTAFGALLLMLLVSETAADGMRARGWHVPASLLQVFAPLKNYEPLGKGLIDSFAVSCALLFAVMFLLLTVRRLDARRLKG